MPKTIARATATILLAPALLLPTVLPDAANAKGLFGGGLIVGVLAGGLFAGAARQYDEPPRAQARSKVVPREVEHRPIVRRQQKPETVDKPTQHAVKRATVRERPKPETARNRKPTTTTTAARRPVRNDAMSPDVKLALAAVPAGAYAVSSMTAALLPIASSPIAQPPEQREAGPAANSAAVVIAQPSSGLVETSAQGDCADDPAVPIETAASVVLAAGEQTAALVVPTAFEGAAVEDAADAAGAAVPSDEVHPTTTPAVGSQGSAAARTDWRTRAADFWHWLGGMAEAAIPYERSSPSANPRPPGSVVPPQQLDPRLKKLLSEMDPPRSMLPDNLRDAAAKTGDSRRP